MEWFLGFLILVNFVVDIALYILYRGGFLRFSSQVKNLAGDVKNLSKRVDELAETQKNLGEFSQHIEEFSQSIEVIENRIGGLYESHAELDEEITKLFNERALPQLVPPEREPAKPNRGGRPRKVG